MAEIILATLNARYIHASFGLRYLLANLGPLRDRAQLLEFDINQRPVDVAESLLAAKPKIIGLGVYIWNAAPTTEVVAILKRARPDVIVVLGGPEVSFEVEQQEIVHLADYVITGEADLRFAELCHELLAGNRPTAKVIPAALPDLNRVALPYDLYTDDDVAHRVVYVEASRGCPFTCEFCLSSLDVPVRQFPLPDLLKHLQRLLERGVRQFKFVDRTFNLNLNVSKTILQFFHEGYREGLFLHFEMIPDRLPEGLRELIARFPAGALQFEVGVQTFNEEVADRIKRRQDNGKLADNLRFLRQHTGVHIHADLIVGLPGESLESFAAGFDRLIALGPQEIQVGLLKRLRGTPIVRHDAEWAMIYNPHPPYEILQNRSIGFGDLQRLRRFARHWDLVGNSGNFIETTARLWRGMDSPFAGFMGWSDWLHARTGRTHGIALTHLAECLFQYLTESMRQEPSAVAQSLWRDYQRGGRSDVPVFLRNHLPQAKPAAPVPRTKAGNKRQARHFARSARL
ncbi:MAG: B12-binding domain-containing radical SAM protein [Limisphaerales bacterium]